MQMRPPASPGSAPSTELGSAVAPPCSLSGSAASAAASLASRPSADAACRVMRCERYAWANCQTVEEAQSCVSLDLSW